MRVGSNVSTAEVLVRLQAEAATDRKAGMNENAQRLQHSQSKAKELRTELKTLRQDAESAAKELENHKGPDGFFAKLFDFGSSARELEGKRHKAESANIAAQEKQVEVSSAQREQKEALEKLRSVLDSAEMAFDDLGKMLKDEAQKTPATIE